MLKLEVGELDRHFIEVFSGSYWTRRRLEIWVDGQKRSTSEARVNQAGLVANGVERFEFQVGNSEPHTVRIERRRAKSGDAINALVDGRPVAWAASYDDGQQRKPSKKKTSQRADPHEPLLAVLGLVIGLGVTAYGIVLVYNVASSPRADAKIVRQLGCEIPPGGDQGLQCDYRLAFAADGRPTTAVIRGVNPPDVTTDQYGNRHLEIYYDAADPSKVGDAQNDTINRVLVLLAGLALLAIVSTAYFKRRALWRDLRVARLTPAPGTQTRLRS